MYKQSQKKPKHFDYDLVVIGSGAAGGVAARTAAELGKKVALIEASLVGGECPYFACIPTKAILEASRAYSIAKDSAQFGIHASAVNFNFSSIMAWKDKAIRATDVQDSTKAFRHENIEVLHGRAHFISRWSVSVGQKRITAKRFLIATGSKPAAPQIPGIRDVGVITNREALNLSRLPKSIFIIGGGPVGCEFAQFFSSLGSKVYIADSHEHLLTQEDSEVGKIVGAIFESRGVRVHTSCKVLGTKKEGLGKKVYFEVNGKKHHVLVDKIMLATGRLANVDLGLENAGVRYSSRGIKTTSRMQTNIKNIFAAGDVTGPYSFTHMSVYQARLAVHNMFSRKSVSANYRAVPRCIFTEPEVAAVGVTENELRHERIPYHKAIVPISMISRSITANHQDGFVKILTSHTGIVLGATIVCPHAGEMIHELALAIHKKLSVSDIAETIHAYPTWSDAVRLCAAKLA